MANSDTPLPWTGVGPGRIVHVAVPGLDHCQAAIVVRAWGDGGTVNLQVFRDGSNDHEALALSTAGHDSSAATRWATSVPHATETGPEHQSWHWPERV